MDAFVKRYSKYLRKSASPSFDRLGLWLEEIESESFWTNQAKLIYTEPSLRDDPERHPIPSPIHLTRRRLKFVDSALRKLREEPKYGGYVKGIEQLEDVLAARVVVYFPHQLTWIDAVLRNSTVLTLDENILPKSFHDNYTLERLGLDPKRFDSRDRKVSGYSSLHYIARFNESELPAGVSAIPFEIQVRTVAEELWGEIEHHVGYKPDRRTAFSVQRQFRVISEHLQAVDMHLDFIYDEMQRFQSDYTVEPTDRLNAENLPVVLSNLGIRVVQHELGPVSDVLLLFDVVTVEDLNRRATYQCLERVRSSWMRRLEVGREPSALMVLNVIASFDGTPTDDEIESRVASFFELYRSMRGDDDDSATG